MKQIVLLCAFFALQSLSIIHAQIPGNECFDPIPYPGDIANGVCVTGYDFSIFNTSALSPRPSCDNNGDDASIWFSWTAPVTTAAGDLLYLDFDSGNCGVGVQFFATDCLTPLSSCSRSFASLVTGVIQGNDYIIQIWDNKNGGNSGAPSCDFCLSVAPNPPLGDECIEPLPYPGDITNGTCVTDFDFSPFTFTYASAYPICAPVDLTVWFSITTPVTTSVGDPIHLFFEGENNCNFSVEFYLTDCLTRLSNCIGGTGILDNLTQGTDYLMVINEFSENNPCDFCISIGPTIPLNNECTGAIPYPGDVENEICVTGIHFAVADDSGSNFPTCGSSGSPDVWYSWTAPVTTVVGDPIDLIFDRGNCGLSIEFYNLDCLTPASNCLSNNSGLVTGLIQGTDYLILVEDYGSGDLNCDFCLTVAPPAPPNDECSEAIPYPGDVENGLCVTSINFSTVTDSGSDLPTCDATGDPDVWYTWTAPVITVPGDPIELFFDDGEGQSNDCSLGIEFYALDCFTPVSNCLTNTSGTITGLTQGTDYLILVYDDGPGGLTCDFCLSVESPNTSCASVNLDILFDGFPGQTSWDITDANGMVVASSNGTYSTQPGNSSLNLDAACLPDGCYDLNFYDTFNNGMCPFQSSAVGISTFITPGTLIAQGTIVGTLSLVASPGLCGNYSLTDANGGTLVSNGGGQFGAQESNQFCLVGGMAPRLANSQIVSKVVNDFAFEVKPSITSDFITVNYTDEIEGKFRVIDLSGKILTEINLSDKEFNGLRIDVSTYNAGVYFLQLITNKSKIVTKKFMKL